MDPLPHLNAREGAARLERGAESIRVLFAGVPDAVARYKPSPERWSLLEIVNHLADEEVLDFRARVERTLRDPAEAWPSIAPQDWVLERAYNQQDPARSLARFLDERARSLAWLRGLGDVDWERAHVHPKAGPLSAHLLLCNWIAHDLLHARQMLRLGYDDLAARAAPGSLDYAGPWN